VRPSASGAIVVLLVPLAVSGCRDVTRYSSTGDHYEGAVASALFVRTGFDPSTKLCLTLDASSLEQTPGTLTSSDGRFHATPLRPMPQVWHDPLSTFTFGEGRVQNMIYVATPIADADALGDVTAVVSLMQTGDVEVRMFRSAPPIDAGEGGASLFGVFSLSRTAGACSF
jgi:hypothetical protein